MVHGLGVTQSGVVLPTSKHNIERAGATFNRVCRRFERAGTDFKGTGTTFKKLAGNLLRMAWLFRGLA